MSKLKLGLIASVAVIGTALLTWELTKSPAMPVGAKPSRTPTESLATSNQPPKVAAPTPGPVSRETKASVVAVAPTPSAAAPAAVDPFAGMIPVEQLVNVGRATPGGDVSDDDVGGVERR